LRIDLNGIAILLISGTASIDEQGRCVHVGDIRAQTQRRFANITGLLGAEGATSEDVVRTTCYLRVIEKDYAAFNEERTAFYGAHGLEPLAGFDRCAGDSVASGIAGGDRGDRHVPDRGIVS
jgi:enamine deaminase RidA (YjgF/YER057c/UK114 family)